MAKKGNNSAILLDEFDFSGETNSIDLTIGVGEEDKSSFLSTAEEYYPLLPNGTLEVGGFLQDVAAADGLEQEMYNRLGTTGIQAIFMVDRTTLGQGVYVIPNAMQGAFNIPTSPTGLITFSASLRSAGGSSPGPQRGVNMLYSTTISAIGTTTEVDIGSAGSSGCYLYLAVQEIDGDKSGTSTNTVITVESSAVSGSGHVTEATATFSATGGVSASGSGTVNRYLQLNCTSLGGATSVKVSALVVVPGVTG